jgi:serine/threonine-protein kinase
MQGNFAGAEFKTHQKSPKKQATRTASIHVTMWAMSETRPKQFGPYVVTALLGKGGMARVYRCTDARNGAVVAVKVFITDADDDARRRFEREIRVMSQLHHPYIAPLLDYNLTPPMTYLVMPYYAGGTVADTLHKATYSPLMASRLLTTLAHALDYAHSQGYIHCDLRPSNFMLDGQGQVVLADFGLAKVIGGEVPSTLTGSLPYLAPELISGGLPDARSDVYALGASLCEILTGHTPFDADDTISYLQLHRRALPPAPSQLNPALPPDLDGPILAALQKSPRDRPQSAGEFAQMFRMAVKNLTDVQQATGAAYVERPVIVYKPLSTTTGVLSTLNDRPTLSRKMEGRPARKTDEAPKVAPKPAPPPPMLRRIRLTVFALTAAVMILVMLGVALLVLILRAGR